MKEIIKILREQLVICNHMREVVGQQREVLLERSSGAAASDAARRLEALLLELSKIEGQQQTFLRSSGDRNLGEFLQRQPASTERGLAVQLLEKVQSIMRNLQELSGQNKRLLQSNMKYISYNINVLAQSVAEPTYAPAGAAFKAASRNMFDQNI